MTATRGSGPAGHPNHKPLWNAYLYGTVVTTCTPAAGGLVAEMFKALPQDPALARAADADMAAPDGAVDSSEDDGDALGNVRFDQFKREVAAWVRAVKDDTVTVARDTDVLKLVSDPVHRARYPLFSIIQVCRGWLRVNICKLIFLNWTLLTFACASVLLQSMRHRALKCSATTCACEWGPTTLSAWPPSWGM
jgi:hypothetical protein